MYGGDRMKSTFLKLRCIIISWMYTKTFEDTDVDTRQLQKEMKDLYWSKVEEPTVLPPRPPEGWLAFNADRQVKPMAHFILSNPA